MTTPFPFVSAAVLTAAQMNAITTLPITTKTASAVAVVGDVGSRIVMNVASANTFTINNSIFAEGDSIFIANKGAGTTTITAGAGVTINGTLTVAQHGGGTLVALSASVFTFFSGASAYGIATGGIGAATAVTINSVNYEYLQFNSTGTLTIVRSGFFDFCAIGGGGGHFYWNNPTTAAGGGGNGCVLIGSVYLSANQTITIGAGGSFINLGSFTQGGNTTIAATSPFSQKASGNLGTHNANTGAAIGFTGGGNGSIIGASSTVITGAFGFNGGNSSSANAAGGGGGQASVGSNGASTTGGAGGSGFDVSVFIGGSALVKATGGGGGGSVTGGVGGSTNACTNSGSATSTPSSAAANTGAGGGGGFSTTPTTGNGGSGICYIRYTV